MNSVFSRFFPEPHALNRKAREFLRYIGPGILVTVGFTDPGNWATNLAAGAEYGYVLLWMVTLSTGMLVVLQHNVAHLGIATGLCLSEAASRYLPAALARGLLATGVAAAIATALAEILGGAIALSMLFHLPIKLGAIVVTVVCGGLLLTNSYCRLEKWIIGFVSLIGLAFLFELSLVQVDWGQALPAWGLPVVPAGAMPVIMGVLGAVVMPHNLFLHSEIIQSREWNLADEMVIRQQLKYEFLDTFLSMGIGWAINSAMILVAASVFFANGVVVEELEQAEAMLRPLVGDKAALVFALALLFSGISSTVTAGMAGGSIFAGIFGEPFDIKDRHSYLGVLFTYLPALGIVFLIDQPFRGLVLSQIFLSIQLPITIALQVYLTSSPRVMGKYANGRWLRLLLLVVGAAVTYLNLRLLLELLAW